MSLFGGLFGGLFGDFGRGHGGGGGGGGGGGRGGRGRGRGRGGWWGPGWGWGYDYPWWGYDYVPEFVADEPDPNITIIKKVILAIKNDKTLSDAEKTKMIGKMLGAIS